MSFSRFVALSARVLDCAPHVSLAIIGDVLDDMCHEALMKTEISSVSRRSQILSKMPTAAFVISADDIRRSGTHTLPDALRMAPGIVVGQLGGGAR